MMRRRNFIRSLFGAAALATSLKLPGAVRHPPGVLTNAQLDRIYNQLMEAAAEAWNSLYKTEFIMIGSPEVFDKLVKTDIE